MNESAVTARAQPFTYSYALTYLELPYLDTDAFLHYQRELFCEWDNVVMSQKCPILPNYYTDNNGKCARYFVCNMQGRTKDPRCPAKGQI